MKAVDCAHQQACWGELGGLQPLQVYHNILRAEQKADQCLYKSQLASGQRATEELGPQGTPDT